MVEPGYVEIAEAARRLGISRTTCREWFDDGLLRGIRHPSGRRRVEEASIEELRMIMRIPPSLEHDADLEALRKHNRRQPS